MSRTITTLEQQFVTDETAGRSGFGAIETERGLLPMVALDVQSRISDLTAETTVRQTFRNPLDEPLEATYIFPLPDRAAVTKFQMIVAGRVLDGVLKERGAAREEYDRAIQDGHRAAIAEEDRSSVFNLRVGNIPPSESVTVELTLVGPLLVSDGEATYRFPLVVAPRYTPGIPLDGPSVGSGTTPDTDEVHDASRVTPPVLLAGFPNPVRLSLSVEIDPITSAGNMAGWGDQLRSSLHSTIAEEGPPWTIKLQPGERLDRDFILRFPVAANAIATSLKASPSAGSQPGVFALTLLPPSTLSPKAGPRQVVFVLDRSGSMGGWKMVAARRALARMIDTLLDHDRFAVLAFDDHVDQPPHAKGALIAGTNRERWQVLEWLGGIGARGGTEMGPALETALQLFSTAGPSSSAPDRILVLVTDGQVTGEDAILRRLSKAAGGGMPRIFTVGIDQAVNAGFLNRLADHGRGNCEFVESEDRLDEAMNRIHRLIGAPVLMHVRLEPLDTDWVAGSLAPAQLPDVFADRPVTIYGRHLAVNSTIRLRVHATDAAGNAWQTEVAGRPGPSSLLSSLWGRARVRELEDQYAAGLTSDQNKLMQQIVELSLENHVLSRFTAYVAVDRSEVVNQGGRQLQIVQPVEMPAGWDLANRGTAFGGMAQACSAPRSTSGSFRKRMKRSSTRYLSPSMPLPSESADSMLCEFTDSLIDFSEVVSATAFGDQGSAPIIRLVQLIIQEAIQQRATEIRLEPLGDRFLVQYLIEGQLVDRESPPLRLFTAVVVRIRNLARLDTAQGTYPQRGRIEVTVGAEKLGLQVEISLSTHGESVVMRFDSAPAMNGPTDPSRSKKFWA